MPVQMKWITNTEQTAGRLFNFAVLLNNQTHNLYPIAFGRFQLLAIFDKWSWQGALHQPPDLQLCKVPFLSPCSDQPPTGTAVGPSSYYGPQPQRATQIMTALTFLSCLKYNLFSGIKGQRWHPRYQSWLFIAPHRSSVTRIARTSIRKGKLD